MSEKCDYGDLAEISKDPEGFARKTLRAAPDILRSPMFDEGFVKMFASEWRKNHQCAEGHAGCPWVEA